MPPGTLVNKSLTLHKSGYKNIRGVSPPLAAENIIRIARRIEKFWDQPVKDSANLLINNVIKDSETRSASAAAA